MQLRPNRLARDGKLRIDGQPFVPGQRFDLIEQLTKIESRKRTDFHKDSVRRPQPHVASTNGQFIAHKRDSTIFDLLLRITQFVQFARDNRFQAKRGSGN